jgi:hypothetical protein
MISTHGCRVPCVEHRLEKVVLLVVAAPRLRVAGNVVCFVSAAVPHSRP